MRQEVLAVAKRNSSRKRIAEIEANNTYNTRDIKNASTSQISSEGLDEFLKTAGKVLLRDNIAKWGAIITLFVGAEYMWLWVVTIICAGYMIYLRKTSKIELTFDEDDGDAYVYPELDRIIGITQSKKVWRIIQSSNVRDSKYAAGANNLVKRKKCNAGTKAPFPFCTEAPCATYKSSKETLLFLPSVLIVIQGSRIGAVNYPDLSLNIYNSTFIETESVPSDAQVIGQTWKYVNKSGGRDSRFKDNKQIPVCNYGNIKVQSNQGLDTLIQYSNANL